MSSAFFEDPKHPDVRPKIAVVITAFLTKKGYGGYFVDDKLETLRMNLRAHNHFPAGVDYDLIIVNHGEPIPPVEQVRNMTIIDRPNEGYGFGGWAQAWEAYGDLYDYYLFCEDDMAPARDGWLAQFVVLFNEDRRTGAIGNFIEARSYTEGDFSRMVWGEVEGYQRDMMYNFDGSYMFTSSKILKQTKGLHPLPCEPHHDRSATVNEVILQLPILELGYRLTSWDAFVVHGSELFTGDVAADPELPIAPLMNLNGRHKVPRVAEVFAPII